VRLALRASVVPVVVACVGLFVWLNTRETRTIAEPVYAHPFGGVPHPPPYTVSEMAIAVHMDRGWPFWHTRATNYFAAHNAALYIDGPWGMGEFHPETNYVRLAVDVFLGLAAVAVVAVFSRLLVRMLCRNQLAPNTGQSQSPPSADRPGG
jgi:hypothetical protein